MGLFCFSSIYNRQAMKKMLLQAVAILFSATIATAQSQKSNCIASPYPVTIVQPDFTTITVVGKGSEAVSYAETIDGYTLVMNDKGFYEYAIPNTATGELTSSGVVAHDPAARNSVERNYLYALNAHARHSEAVEQKMFDAYYRQDDVPSAKQLSWGFPSTGSRKLLMILIEYPDLRATETRQELDDMMNKQNFHGTGSFKDYYKEVSYGKFDISTDVVGWFMASNNYSYYGQNNPNYTAHVRELVAQAIDSAEAAGVDFTQYDNNNDGDLDGIAIVHSGPGAEAGSQKQYIWSHRYNLAGEARVYDGIYINEYMVQPEKRGNDLVGIGVYCHEFGHILGLPDLYDVNGGSEGIGEWGLMGSCGWLNNEHTPCHMDAWCKTQMDWLVAKEINTSGAYTLENMVDDTLVYKLTTPLLSEYYLLENRQQKGFDAYLKGSGLAIWRINTLKTSLFPFSNSVNNDENNKGVWLMEADGKKHLDNQVNRSDNGDLYPGASGNIIFDDNSVPSSKLRDGTPTNITVSNIKNENNIVSFNFGARAFANYSLSVSGGCVPFTVNMTNQSKFAYKYHWDFGDGNTDTVVNPTHLYDNVGTYQVKLYVYNDSNIVVDSMTKTVDAKSKALAEFSYTINGLEATFTNNSVGATSYFWSFGDGTPLVAIANPAHTYDQPGDYNVILIAKNNWNCNDTMKQMVDIWAASVDPLTTGVEANVFPNPMSKSATLRLYARENAAVHVDLFDLNGRKLANVFDGEGRNEIMNISLQAAELKIVPGIYLLAVSRGEEMVNLRLVVTQ